MIDKLAIIELDYHEECLDTLCKLLSESSIKVEIYTKKSIYQEVNKNKKYNNLTWYIPKKGESIRKFIKRSESPLNENQVILFNTLASNFFVFSKLNLKPITILRIHNANSYLSPINNIKFIFSYYSIYKDSSHILREGFLKLNWLFRRKCIQKMDYLNFPTQEIEDYILSKKMLTPYRHCNSIPLSIVDEEIKIKTRNISTYNITVIGTIEKKRRNYTLLYESIKTLITQTNQNVNITFAGKVKGKYGKMIIEKFLNLNHINLNIIYFNNRISQSRFDHIMSETDCIIAPLNIQTRYTIYKEEYGKTKASGNVSDITKYRKKGIVPYEYPLSNTEKKYIKQYKNKEDIVNILIDEITENKGIKADDYMFFSKQNVLTSFVKTINSLTKKTNQ